MTKTTTYTVTVETESGFDTVTYNCPVKAIEAIAEAHDTPWLVNIEFTGNPHKDALNQTDCLCCN